MGMSARLRSALGLAGAVFVAGAALQGLQAWTGARAGVQVAAQAKPGDIFMISSVTCSYCERARAWFTEHRVPFTECMIERDSRCAATYTALMAPGTPVLLVRGQRLVGFNARAVAQTLVGSLP